MFIVKCQRNHQRSEVAFLDYDVNRTLRMTPHSANIFNNEIEAVRWKETFAAAYVSWTFEIQYVGF